MRRYSINWDSPVAQAVLIIGCLLFFTLLDILVVDNIFHALHRKGVDWEMLHTQMRLPWVTVKCLYWHPVFFIVTLVVTLGTILITGRWVVAICTYILFAGGWEDFLYYLWHAKLLPDDLHTLSEVPTHKLSMAVLGAQQITPACVYLSMGYTLLMVVAIVCGTRRRGVQSV